MEHPSPAVAKPRDEPAPPAPRPRKSILWIAATAALLTALLHAPRLGRPLERSLASANTTYMVMFFRNWDAVGFDRLRGIATVGTIGQDARTREPYLHHPPASYWAMYAARSVFGWTEAAFRLVPFLGLLGAAFLTVLLAARFTAPVFALAAGVLLPCTGLAFGFGLMPGTESLILCVLLAGVLAYLRVRERPGLGRRLVLWAIVFVGCWVDWQASFLVPALLVFELLSPDRRRLLEPLLLVPVVLAAYALLLGYFAWGLAADLDTVVADLQSTVTATVVGQEVWTVQGFVANQLKTWRQYLGWPLMALAFVLLLAAVVRPRTLRTREGALLAGLAVPVLVSISLFRAPAFDHDFYWMPILAVLPLGLALCLQRLWRGVPLLATAGAVLVFVWCGTLSLLHEQETADSYYRDIGHVLNQMTESDDLIFTPESDGPTMFYTDARMWGSIREPAILELAFQKREQSLAAFKRLFVYIHPWNLETYAPLVGWLDEHGKRVGEKRARVWSVERP